MPRGIPKKGQFCFQLWLPGGGRLQFSTTGDHSRAKWCAAVRKQLMEIGQIVDRVEALAGSPATSNVPPAPHS